MQLMKGDNHVDASSVCDVYKMGMFTLYNYYTDNTCRQLAGMNMSKHSFVQLFSFNFLLPTL